MKPHVFALAVGSILLAHLPVRAADAPSYKNDIKPLLAKYCITCHGGERTRANVDLTSVQTMLKGGKRSVPLVPGKPEMSNLVRTIQGGRPVMPPRKFSQQPTKQEIALIRDWVAAGAKDDSATAALPADLRDTLARLVEEPISEQR